MNTATTADLIRSANDSARTAFGADIRILVARSPAFGHEDTLILVDGKRHAEAAAAFARTSRGAKVGTETTGGWMGLPVTQRSVVAIAAV